MRNLITIDKIEHTPEYEAYLRQLPQELLLKIVENAFAEFFVNDKDGRVVYVNPSSMRYHGLQPEELVGKQVIAVLNLAPRKIRGLMSDGMVLTAEKDGKLSVLTPAAPVPNGSQIA